MHPGGGGLAARRQRHRAAERAGPGVLRRADRSDRDPAPGRGRRPGPDPPADRAPGAGPHRRRQRRSAARQRAMLAEPTKRETSRSSAPVPAMSTTSSCNAGNGGPMATAARPWWRWKTAKPTSWACRWAMCCASKSPAACCRRSWWPSTASAARRRACGWKRCSATARSTPSSPGMSARPPCRPKQRHRARSSAWRVPCRPWPACVPKPCCAKPVR